MQKIILVSIAALCCTSVFGQISTNDLKARAKTEKLKDVVIGYEKSTDRTTIITKPEELLRARPIVEPQGGGAPGSRVTLPPMLFIDVGYEGPGDGLKTTPDDLRICFTTNAADWPFLKGDNTLYITYDDKRMVLRPADRDAS